MNALAAVPSKIRIVMLDACRNNPFDLSASSGGRGLAIVDAPSGSIVAYATAPGAEAADGAGAQQPVHGRVPQGRETAGAADRAVVQAYPAARERRHRRQADSVGKLLADQRLLVLPRRGRDPEEDRFAARSER